MPAVAEGAGRFRVGSVSLAVGRDDIAAGTRVKLYLRPEEIGVHVNGHAAQGAFAAADCESRVPRRVLHGRARARRRRHAAARRERPAPAGRRRRSRARIAGHHQPARVGDARPLLTWQRPLSHSRGAPLIAAGPRTHWHDRLAQGLLLICCAALALFLIGPLLMILVKSVQDKDGVFVGLQPVPRVLRIAGSVQRSIRNTLWVATVVTAITIPLAFSYAYALTRSCMPGKTLFRVIALTPILAPSLMAAISFIQWFGTQGLLKGLLGGASVYGPIGIILSSVYATFPHALMIVLTALLLADGRLYEAAESLRAPASGDDSSRSRCRARNTGSSAPRWSCSRTR